MKNSLKQNIIKKISKILKLKTYKQLSKIKRSQYDVWDSLVHLHIFFTIEKNIKKKIHVSKLNKISKGDDIIKLLNENIR